MGKKTRNWLYAGIGVAMLVLGVPLAEQVIATGTAAETAQKAETCSAHQSGPAMGHPSVIMLGDNYLQIIPTGDGSIGAMLYDSNFTVLGANENEASLTFALPDGTKKNIQITIPDAAALRGQAGAKACCPNPGSGPMPENCPHRASDQQESAPTTN